MSAERIVLSPAQRKVLERLANGDRLVLMSGLDAYYTFFDRPNPNSRTIHRLQDLKLIRGEYRMGSGSSDYFITDAGRAVLKAQP